MRTRQVQVVKDDIGRIKRKQYVEEQGWLVVDDITKERIFTSYEQDALAVLGNILGTVIAYRREVEEYSREISALSKVAFMDRLTGLPGRRYLEALLQTIIKKHVWEPVMAEGKYFLIMMDLDKFKNVNDTYGHKVGDDVIIAAAKTLNQYTSEMARLGGDEFIAVCEGTRREAQEVMEEMRQNWEVSPEARGTTMSIGISEISTQRILAIVQWANEGGADIYSEDLKSLIGAVNNGLKLSEEVVASLKSLLYQYADKQLYRAKKQGRNCIIVGW